ncbi:uncharacterized protein LOC126968335 isoform X2 [Leptidea sinapis]|nr:uncharacterized protein LOC126968335 isoform X2 [Leptidea sinapis]XP_050669264.1 uncharacterized protein LOC126968335 isoform X2 [Leptidea sinapis]
MDSPSKKIGKKRKQKQINTNSKVPKLQIPNTDIVLSEKNSEITTQSEARVESLSPEDITKKYPLLDNEFIKKFQSVPLSNNQKGRIRQLLRDGLRGTTNQLLPDVIYSQIQIVAESKTQLTEPELRKIRILYNMLMTAVQSDSSGQEKTKKKKKKSKKAKPEKVTDNKDGLEAEIDKQIQGSEEAVKNVSSDTENKGISNVKDKSQKEQKVRGPKRYVVFIGNLPIDITKEKIMTHFSDLKKNVVDVRIPKQEDKKSGIAYVELKDEASYELALSRHHTMLESKRINVLYTTQKNTKISASEAKRGQTGKRLTGWRVRQPPMDIHNIKCQEMRCRPLRVHQRSYRRCRSLASYLGVFRSTERGV